ncbi:MarR family winged helix-turn-helix transcriptional regulator [Mangrovibrevibacter kandeliae]|uniref:MarR family winged helix-turn-helix transcriptional regulator n=1 Tax=Mangrovibrevibacter kandeliae TaxID=2968473 RepID=UPI00211978D7|nr:MarR family winged helix-turn-helix transcriptional regulator [Aurantimonas sp. CSK15Z-1]
MDDARNLDGEPLISFALARAATAFGRAVAQVYRGEAGLSGPEFAVIQILGAAASRRATSSEIVAATTMDKTKVSRAVASLAARGWLQRVRAETDRRYEFLSLTPDGEGAYATLVPHVRDVEESVLARLTEEERRNLCLGLLGLLRSFDARD